MQKANEKNGDIGVQVYMYCYVFTIAFSSFQIAFFLQLLTKDFESQ